MEPQNFFHQTLHQHHFLEDCDLDQFFKITDQYFSISEDGVYECQWRHQWCHQIFNFEFPDENIPKFPWQVDDLCYTPNIITQEVEKARIISLYGDDVTIQFRDSSVFHRMSHQLNPILDFCLIEENLRDFYSKRVFEWITACAEVHRRNSELEKLENERIKGDDVMLMTSSLDFCCRKVL